MLPKISTLIGLALASGLVGAGCAADEDHTADFHGESSHVPESAGSELGANDSVSRAVTATCSTVTVKGLATQLVDEIQCMRPGSMKRIDEVPGISLDPAVFPWLQTPAADALIAAKSARDATLSLNSALRTLPQQYLLYRWYRTGRCNIGLAATPGSSNHESGLAIDIDSHEAWRQTMSNEDFTWLGASDPVHFDFTGAGTTDMSGLSVLAFQRLWNRNHPEDPIPTDGEYGADTEERLAKSPIGGFAKTCTDQ